MGRIRSRGKRTTELKFVSLLRAHKIRGWRRGRLLPGRPDFVFARAKLVIFIDGDFWHGNPKTFRLPKSNLEYWKPKIQRNIDRDKTINRTLRAMGWHVLRIWESYLKNEASVLAKLRVALAKEEFRGEVARITHISDPLKE